MSNSSLEPMTVAARPSLPHHCFSVRGDFSELDVYFNVHSNGSLRCCGGSLRMAGTTITLCPDHAANIAERMRHRIDEMLLGSIPGPVSGKLQ